MKPAPLRSILALRRALLPGTRLRLLYRAGQNWVPGDIQTVAGGAQFGRAEIGFITVKPGFGDESERLIWAQAFREELLLEGPTTFSVVSAGEVILTFEILDVPEDATA